MVQRTIKQGEFMSGRYYERDEDWLVTCPECHGKGTIGTGILEFDAQNVMEQGKLGDSKGRLGAHDYII